MKTGNFDKIMVGVSTKRDVIELMGSDFDFCDFGETQIIKYGWYEFFYWTKSEVIFAIQNDHLRFSTSNHDEMVNYQNENVKVDSWFLGLIKTSHFQRLLKF